MNRVTITLTIDLPDGVIPDVGYGAPDELVEMVGTTSVPARTPTLDTDARVAAAPVFPPMVALATPRAPLCTTHGTAMVRWPAGVNKAGKPYNASWRCAVKDCPTKPLWDRDAA